MVRYLFLIVCIIISLSTQALAQQTWVPFLTNEVTPPMVTLKVSDKNNVSFSGTTNGMFRAEKSYKGIEYQRIRIPDCECITEEGSPEIPVIRQLIAIPDCDEIKIKIDKTDSLIIDNYDIIPAPKYLMKNNYYIEEFTKNDSIYSTNTYFPSTCGRIVEPGKIRNQSVVRVEIHPIQFNPISKQLKIYTNLEIKLEFINPTSDLIKNVGPFYKACKGAILNYN